MADFRQLHTKIWIDSWFIGLMPEQKLLFIYLFSNQRASVCGLFELPVRVMAFDTGLDTDTIKKYLGIFAKANKAHYDFKTSVLWLVNMPKYQSSSSPKLRTRIEADIKAVPVCELKIRFLERYHEYTISIPYSDGSDTPISVSVSDSIESLSLERGGAGGKTLSPADRYNQDLFTSRFGVFDGQAEGERWMSLVLKHGRPKTLEILEWAEKREINRDVLLDSIETAAENWNGHKPKNNGGKHANRTADHTSIPEPTEGDIDLARKALAQRRASAEVSHV